MADRQAVPAMQAMFLLDNIGNAICHDAVLRTDCRTTSTAEASASNEITLCFFL